MERKIRLLESVLTQEQLDLISILEKEPMDFQRLVITINACLND